MKKYRELEMNIETPREKELEMRCEEMAQSFSAARAMLHKGILGAANALERGENSKAELILRRLLTNP